MNGLPFAFSDDRKEKGERGNGISCFKISGRLVGGCHRLPASSVVDLTPQSHQDEGL
jgi:hypothetical protein